MPRRTFVSRGRKIDFKNWEAMPSIDLSLTADGTSLGGGLGFLQPATVLRTRGTLVISPSAAVVALDSVKITVGIGVVSSDAFAAGAGSIPDPDDEPEFPWLFWRSDGFFYAESSFSNGVASRTGAMRYDVDSKAMRKMKPGEALAWVVQYVDIVGAPPMKVKIATTRVLIGT